MKLLWIFLCFQILRILAEEREPRREQNEVLRPKLLSLKTVVESGITLAIEHCKLQFKWDRWNCPETAFTRVYSALNDRWSREAGNLGLYQLLNITPLMHRRGKGPIYPETAFVQAITAAGVVYSITKGCSSGILDCGCMRHLRDEGTQKQDWLWIGCSDNVKVGIDKAKGFLGALEKKIGTPSQIGVHNTLAGEEAVRLCMELQCKCFGLSGSCTTKVCWKQLCPFERIAVDLRYRYDRAVRFPMVEDTAHEQELNKVLPKEALPEITTRYLVYIDDPPNYCIADENTEWPGTIGRMCSKNEGRDVSPQERASCSTVCEFCNYSVMKSHVVTTYQCHCSFHWCCEVKCEVCANHTLEYFCV